MPHYQNGFLLEALGEDADGMIRDIKVTRVAYFSSTDTLSLHLESMRLLSERELDSLKQEVARWAGVQQVQTAVRYDAGSLSAQEAVSSYFPGILAEALNHNKAAMSLLANCRPEVDGNSLKIILESSGGSGFLSTMGLERRVEEVLANTLGMHLKVGFEGEQACAGSGREYEQHKRRTVAESLQKAVAWEKKADLQTEDGKPPEAANMNGFRQLRTRAARSKDAEKCPGLIVGGPFDGPLVPISSLREDTGLVCLEAEVLNLEKKELKGGEKLLYLFDVTDFTESIPAKLFLRKPDAEFVDERLKPGVRVRILGEALYDKYAREAALTVRSMIRIPKQTRKDNAPEKRVELHLHSRMSAMDSVADLSQAIRMAAEWGHPALAVTDHGVVQAFVDPDAARAQEETGLKLIYGMECYMLEDEPDFMWNMDDRSMEGTLVFLDFETTGLAPGKDQVIEIGAVRYRGGAEEASFQSFVNPGRKITSRITEITGITEADLEDAPAMRDVLPDLLEFIGDSTLGAHNAEFDMAFLAEAMKQNSLQLKNPVVDTLQLARLTLPLLDNHKLGTIARAFGIDPKAAHRAVEDARTTAQIFYALTAKAFQDHAGQTQQHGPSAKSRCFLDLWQHYQGSAAGDPPGRDWAIHMNKKDRPNRVSHCLLLVKNLRGLKDLYRLVSMSHLAYFYKKPRIPKQRIAACREGLLIGSACNSGELYRAILNDAPSSKLEQIAGFYDFLEIQPVGNSQFLVREGTVPDLDALRRINARITAIGEKLGIPVAATGDVHFLEAREEVFRRILMAGQKYEDADHQPPLYFRTTEEMLEEFSYLGAEKAWEVVITTPRNIAAMVEDGIRPIPEGTYPPVLEGAAEEVRDIAMAKACSLYGDPLPDLILNRLEKELKSIIGNGFAVMYSAAYRLVSKSLSDGYSVGSRGSVGSSLVATLMGITEVNPLPPHYRCPACRGSDFETGRHAGSGFDLPPATCPLCQTALKGDGHNIPFETFLGFKGEKAPDIDLNFSGVYQPVAHKYTEELFGSENIFRAGTISTIAGKLALAYVRKYFEERGRQVSGAEERRLAAGCTGVKKTTGQHPGGMIVLPKGRDIHEFSPVQRPADRSESAVVTTHFDFNSLHDTILKLDILGHDNPTMLKELADLSGVSMEDVPVPDPMVLKLFQGTEPLGASPEEIGCSLGVLGLPEMGTGFVIGMLEAAKPVNFSDLLQISGLSHGTDVWLGNAQELIARKTCTISEVIGTRDSIMITLMEHGLEPSTAFKIMENVRKGKGLTPDFIDAMKEKGVPDWYIESCLKIKYMFPKAHAAAYVIAALRLGWYKIYRPLDFYSVYYSIKGEEFDALLMCDGLDKVSARMESLKAAVVENNQENPEEDSGGEGVSAKDKRLLALLGIIREMYARGYGFAPVDLYESDAVRFMPVPDTGRIRPPFTAIKGLGATVAGSIVEARKAGAFSTVDDFILRTRINRKSLELLRECGCLQNLRENTQISLFDIL
ncbi:MAG TPA: PolC-type DNA polymerase III [Clostridiales bacterium]|nr:PolC-type DNA polymerase III [Clostridiales bacterium]